MNNKTQIRRCLRNFDNILVHAFDFNRPETPIHNLNISGKTSKAYVYFKSVTTIVTRLID